MQNSTGVLKYADEGYDSFKAFKKANGPAGPGKEWHHIVEQSQIKKSGFSVQQINSNRNMVAIDKEVHRKISAHYSSKPTFTNGLTVRNWLSSQSFNAQYNYGIAYLNKILGNL